MNENTPDQAGEVACGWVFYDGECSLCLTTVKQFGSLLRRHHFQLAPLQMPWVQERLGLTSGELLMEMKLVTIDGQIYGGADALAQIARTIWWAWPLYAMAKIPGIRHLFHLIYRWIAANRTCLGNACRLPHRNRFVDYLPLLALPVGVVFIQSIFSPWVFMWLLALAIYCGCKWLTWRQAASTNRVRSFGYLLGWVGMDAKHFLSPQQTVTKPATRQWFQAAVKVVIGASLIWLVARHLVETQALMAGWIGMIGIVLCLHFGVFELLALAWQQAGVGATPIMQKPLQATSLADFWGHRWNRAFHVLAHGFVFQRLARKYGLTVAMVTAFLISGLIHDAVISLPAHGGFGLPTAYFLLQALGIIFERTAFARHLGLGHGWRGWLFTVVFTAGPAFWLFHPPFIHNVILPMLHALGAT